MNPTQPELTALLTDVRKSYRLLHDYQRLILDSLCYLGHQLDIPYRGGWTGFSGAQPREGKGSLQNWSWDWLGMYHYEFRFDLRAGNHRRIDIPENEYVTLCARVINDTGFYEVSEDNPNVANTESFLPAPEAQTKVVFLLFQGPWKGLPMLGDPPLVRDIIAENTPWPSALSDDGIHGFCSDISELLTQDGANGLIHRILEKAQTTNLPLYRRGEAPEEIQERIPER